MSEPKPKVLLFDIGGVCVVSPFQAILDYELSLGIPPGGFSRDLHDPVRWKTFYKREQNKNPSLSKETPPVPSIDAEWLFNEMMTVSNNPDPWMFPALKKLKNDGRFILAALSNTVIFPASHKLHFEHFFDEPVRQIFDVFVSSAHVGIRKPDPAMYKLALDRVNEFAKANAHSDRGKSLNWEAGVKPEEVTFLDDIGENLKEARKQGLRTIKVNLGRAFEAVDELEIVTGLKLAGDHPRIPVEPKVQKVKAKM
ncbi:microsomal epoxide hydrolase [Fusarium beomiforme]|uniref:Microsomal epoxide hydrolase n=1 Tax=Fusarium beomiforme TaxID=44412 RepID=A0A9P5AAJ3_9HYPO|nr:microsomal epoxide hydrolase [Fusarium beomiforme]